MVDEDRRFYLKTLTEDCRRCGVGVLGYCLMTNHVHLVAVPKRAAQLFNRRYGRSGHLWQNRFFSCPLGRDHLLTALFYVDQIRCAPGWWAKPSTIREWPFVRRNSHGSSARALTRSLAEDD